LPLELVPLSDHLGVEVRGVDLSKPVDDATFAELRHAFDNRNLLLFRDQQLSVEQQLDFSRRWGPLEQHVLKQFTLPGYPELFVLTNKKDGDKPQGAHKVGWHWHIDNTYMQRSSLGSLLYAKEIPPEGGDTLFTSLAAAYDGLPEAMKRRIDGLKAVHSYIHVRSIKWPNETLTEEQKARVPDIVHALVRVHPATGRKVLYVGEYVIKQFLGMSMADSKALLDELNAHATEPRFVYRHRWRVSDLMFWDNRATMHCAQPYDDMNHTRLMHTTRIVMDDYRGEIVGDAARAAAAEPAPIY
jgi:taurine dioxygenase